MISQKFETNEEPCVQMQKGHSEAQTKYNTYVFLGVSVIFGPIFKFYILFLSPNPKNGLD